MTPEAIRDLVKRLRHGAEGYGHHLSTLREAAAALEQLLTTVEEAERVIEPFAEITGVWPDPDAGSNLAVVMKVHGEDIWRAHLETVQFYRARDWRTKHGSAGR